MKTCSKCGEIKDLSEFSLKNPRTGTRSAWCRICNRAYQKLHYINNKSVYASKARAYEAANGGKLGKRLRNHGLTEDKYLALLSKYNGECWMRCGRPGTEIDHDHSCCPRQSSCGKCVRGILCVQCNTGLGFLGDSQESLQRALNYLAQ